jgi:hypothetical protein
MLKWAKLPAAFIQDRRITLTEFRVYAALLLCRETEEGYREPTQMELMEFTGLIKAQTSSAIAGLERSGWLRREIGNGRGKKSRYWLTTPSPDQAVKRGMELIPLSEPEKVTDLIPLSNEKGSGIDTPLEPERLRISPPFSDEDTIYKRNKEEKSKERVKIKKQEPENSEPKASRKKPAVDLSEIVLPDWLPIDIWEQWIAYRSERKPALTARSAQMTITQLSKARQCGHAPENLIASAIANGWQGCVFDKHLTGYTKPTGVNHDQYARTQSAAPLRGAALKQRNDDQLDDFLNFGITPGLFESQSEKDITATAVRID